MPPKPEKRRSLPVAIDRLALQRLRRGARLTQVQLGKRAGISKAYICQLEKGAKNPGIDYVRALAAALGCEESDLLADEPNGTAA